MSVLKVRGIRHDAASTDAINLDSSGNVLIGTTTHHNFSGSTTEVVVGTTGTGTNAGGAITFGSGSGFLGYLGFQESAGTIGTYTSVPLLFSTSNTERMRIDASGRVTMPYQPAFNAYCSQNTNSTTQAIVPFNSTRLNVGNHFDTSTYTFTAPVAGSYFFTATIYIQKNSTAYANLGLRKNGTTLLYTETEGTTTQLCLTTSMVMTLAASDTVYAFFGNNGSRQYYQGGTEDSFSGFLIG